MADNQPGGEAQGGEEMLKQPRDINLNKLSKENLKTLAQALIGENTEMERELEEARQKLNQLEGAAQKAKQLGDMYAALNNDFNNYRRRNAEIEVTSKDNAAVELALKIIPVYENLRIAAQNIAGEKDKEGVLMIYRQFTDVLEALGISRIDSEGQPFDPQLHCALMAEDTGDENLKGRIKQVFADGYRYKDKVIKQSQVVVYK
jgi:molecular chaperone GrpE